MKILIAYYSRTETSKKVAEVLAKKLGADIEEIKDHKDRFGVIGYARAGRDAMRKAKTKIEDLRHNPSEYDLVILGTPVWAWTITPALRTYIDEQKEKFNKVAVLMTQGAEPPKQESIFSEIEELCGKKSQANLHLSTSEVKKEKILNQVDKFISKLN